LTTGCGMRAGRAGKAPNRNFLAKLVRDMRVAAAKIRGQL
jgi:hypothetical protein